MIRKLIYGTGAALATGFAASAAWAQEAAEAVADSAVEATAAVVEAAPAAAVAFTPTADMVNKGDVAWMMVSTALVLMMSVPALALFYGGLVRAKNMLSVLMQVFMVFALISVLWVVYGYSLAFTAGNPFFGTLDKLFLKGITGDSVAATFSGVTRKAGTAGWATANQPSARPASRALGIYSSACRNYRYSRYHSTCRP